MTLDPHTNGASRSAADRTEPMFAYLVERRRIALLDLDVPAGVRKLLLAGHALTREQIQDELGSDPRVPLGQIAAALDQIGATVDGEERWRLCSAEDAEAIAKRRADVLEAALADGTSRPFTATEVFAELNGDDGEEHLDVVMEALGALAASGVLVLCGTESGAALYDLSGGITEKITRLGAEAVARSTVPELASAIADRTEYERVATERFEAERKAKLVAHGERDRLSAWLREKGQDPGEILSDEASA